MEVGELDEDGGTLPRSVDVACALFEALGDTPIVAGRGSDALERLPCRGIGPVDGNRALVLEALQRAARASRSGAERKSPSCTRSCEA
jgi:hypothetical protein